MADHAVGTQDEWLAARKELLAAEKEHMRQGDELARRRRELPWVPVSKQYSFETGDGKLRSGPNTTGRIGTTSRPTSEWPPPPADARAGRRRGPRPRMTGHQGRAQCQLGV